MFICSYRLISSCFIIIMIYKNVNFENLRCWWVSWAASQGRTLDIAGWLALDDDKLKVVEPCDANRNYYLRATLKTAKLWIDWKYIYCVAIWSDIIRCPDAVVNVGTIYSYLNLMYTYVIHIMLQKSRVLTPKGLGIYWSLLLASPCVPLPSLLSTSIF